MIKDSGERRQFKTGAVRDISDDKGRCDLLPLDVVSNYLSGDKILQCIEQFKESGDTDFLYIALAHFDQWDPYTTVLEVSKHFAEGAKKYTENNWKLGINAKHYIDSGTRHYLKWLRGDIDEPHDRAFCWNIICCIWTCKHKPELNDYRKDDTDESKVTLEENECRTQGNDE